MQEVIDNVAAAMRKAEYIIALTGAGISKESNIPTFRGKDGLWKNYDAMELATPGAFRRNPELVWEWYTWRQGLIADCDPNPAHHTLAKWEKEGILKSLITQNVDGLHRRSGSENVHEVHGNLWALKCTYCDHRERLSSPAQGVPKCPSCGSMLRPDVVWFGEGLPQNVLIEVNQELRKADLCFVIGTSAIVYPAAAFPLVVKENGGILVEVNTEETNLSQVSDFNLFGKAGVIMPQIDEAIL